VRHTDAGLVVAFPRTNNAACWVADLDALTVDVPGVGAVHRGFWGAWQAIAAPVTAAGAQPVTRVGHSLGAAIAILAAVSLTLTGLPPAAVYGFGPPRVSPDLGVRTLLARVPVHLYRNGLDVVTDLPPDWHHAALLTHIGAPALPIVNIEDHQIACY